MNPTFLDMLWDGLKLTQAKTQIAYPDNEENLCDFLITFFEELNFYKTQIQKDINKARHQSKWFNLALTLLPLTSKVFQTYVKTTIDKITYNFLFVSLFNSWINDNTADSSKTLDEINALCKNIYQHI